jgi:hypothetical protein
MKLGKVKKRNQENKQQLQKKIIDLNKSSTPYSFNSKQFSEKDFVLQNVIGKCRNGLVCIYLMFIF